jgi:branched-chain amino acid transport system ATP-binding protein
MLLAVNDVSKSFGGLRVLTNVSTDINSGEIIGLIGPNGAGKSTLFNIITGIYVPTSGSIQLGKQELVGLPPHRICRMGISRTFQLVKVFSSLTAFDNVRVGALFGRGSCSERSLLEPSKCLDMVGLSDQADRYPTQLTFSDRRRLEVARALAANPDLLLLDEPLAGLTDAETQTMTRVIGKIRDETGMSVFWIEHQMEAVFKLCDKIVVLDFGVIIAEGSPAAVAKDERVIEAYLGSEVGVAHA